MRYSRGGGGRDPARLWGQLPQTAAFMSGQTGLGLCSIRRGNVGLRLDAEIYNRPSLRGIAVMTDFASASASRRTAAGHSVIAVLGPTNTGKTHLAIERMLGHETGLIGLPLRLLAREVYDKVVARVGEANVALITGEEKIMPERPRYWVCTVEAMPRDIERRFPRGRRDPARRRSRARPCLHRAAVSRARGASETLLLGADDHGRRRSATCCRAPISSPATGCRS